MLIRLRGHSLLVIPRSFLFLPGIGEKREVALWRRGITHWRDYPRDRPPRGVPTPRHAEHCRLLERATKALDTQDLSTLSRLIPKNEHWRFWGPIAPRVGCLDIETTGTHEGARVTVVGVHDATSRTTHQLVADRDLTPDALKRLLARFDLFVTFNGNGFDLPVLRGRYPRAVPTVPHLDLRGPLRRLGYRGGLKKIETDLGIARPDDVHGIDGFEAVRLWRRHERGDARALDTLLAYNEEDVRNLVPLAHFVTTVLRNTHAPLWQEPVEPVPWPGGTPPQVLPPPLRHRLAGRQDARLD